MPDDTTGVLTPTSLGGSTVTSPASPVPAIDLAADSAVRESNGRVLAPSRRLSTITTTTIATNDADGPSPTGAGPTRKDYTVPPRPRPGRRPATDQPESKRKAQNRESQRAFRARKAAKTDELIQALKEAREAHRADLDLKDQEIFTLQSELHLLQASAAELRKSEREAHEALRYWKQRCDDLEHPGNTANGHVFPPTTLQGSLPQTPTAGTGSNVDALGTPVTPEAYVAAIPLTANRSATPAGGLQPHTINYDEHELDFTAIYASTKPRNGENAASSYMAVDITADDPDCGFCTNPDNCICRRKDLHMDIELQPLSQIPSGAPLSNTLPPLRSGPGSCADCQANPEQRAWCQRIAQLRGEARPVLSRRNSSMSTASLNVLEPRVDSRIDMNVARSSPVVGDRSIGCSEAFKLLDGRVPLDDNRVDWTSLNPVSSEVSSRTVTIDASISQPAMEPGTYSAMELDAAGIITTLQHTMGPLEPRESDGNNKHLVQIAGEIRQSTDTPKTLSQDDTALKIVDDSDGMEI